MTFGRQRPGRILTPTSGRNTEPQLSPCHRFTYFDAVRPQPPRRGPGHALGAAPSPLAPGAAGPASAAARPASGAGQSATHQCDGKGQPVAGRQPQPGNASGRPLQRRLRRGPHRQPDAVLKERQYQPSPGVGGEAVHHHGGAAAFRAQHHADHLVARQRQPGGRHLHRDAVPARRRGPDVRLGLF